MLHIKGIVPIEFWRCPLQVFILYYQHIDEKQKKKTVESNVPVPWLISNLKVSLRKMCPFSRLLMLACFSSFKKICESNIFVPFWHVLNSLLLLDHVVSFQNLVVTIMSRHVTTCLNPTSIYTLTRSVAINQSLDLDLNYSKAR